MITLNLIDLVLWSLICGPAMLALGIWIGRGQRD